MLRRLSCLCLAGIAFLAGCRKGGRPGVTQRPWGPHQARTNRSYSFSAFAVDPDGDSVALRFDWDGGDVSVWYPLRPPGETLTVAHRWLRPCTSHVRAQAKDARGNLSQWSASPLRVTITDSFSNCPAVPTPLTSPDTAWRGIVYGFRTSSTDADSDWIHYEFDWADGTTHLTPEVASGETVTATHEWNDSGVHLVRIRAIDRYDSASAWTPPCTVRVRPEGTVKWHLNIGASYVCPAVGDDGVIYTAGARTLAAVSPDGLILWEVPTDPCGLALDSLGVLLCAGDVGGLQAVNADGSRRWEVLLGGHLEYAPVIGPDRTIYYVPRDGELRAVTPEGTVTWSVRLNDPVRSAPAIGPDGTVYAITRDSIVAVNPDGTERWRIHRHAASHSGMAIGSDGTIYIPHDLCAYSPDGVQLWQTALVCRRPPAVGTDGTIYVPGSGALHAVNPDGSVRWSLAVGSGYLSTPALAADGTVYVCSGDNWLSAVTTQGKLRWRSCLRGDPGSAQTTIGRDGTVYVCGGSELFALVGSAPLAEAPWPKYQHDLRNSGCAGAR